MNLITLFIILLFVAFILIGFFVFIGLFARTQMLEEELDNSISKEEILFAIHDSLLPNKISNSATWNAALLDMETRLGLRHDGKR